MIPWLIKLFRWVLWGSSKWRLPAPESPPLNVGSSRACGWTYGDVITSVYLNHNHKGQPYFKATFRKVVKDGRYASNSFLIDDLKDIEFGIARVRAWVHDSKIT